MKVKDILEEKGTEVYTTGEDETILEALSKLAAYKIGSLLVLNRKSRIVGILTPRDILLGILNEPDSFKNIKVKDVMTKDILVSNFEDDVNDVRAIMTKNRVRHLPVIQNNALAGIVSIGDVMKAELEEKHLENRYLKDYIMGKYPG